MLANIASHDPGSRTTCSQLSGEINALQRHQPKKHFLLLVIVSSTTHNVHSPTSAPEVHPSTHPYLESPVTALLEKASWFSFAESTAPLEIPSLYGQTGHKCQPALAFHWLEQHKGLIINSHPTIPTLPQDRSLPGSHTPNFLLFSLLFRHQTFVWASIKHLISELRVTAQPWAHPSRQPSMQTVEHSKQVS